MKKVSHSTKSISLILIAALATGACTKEVTKIEQVEVVKTQPGANTNEQPIKISADDTMTADALVEIGEQLVSPYEVSLKI